MQNLKQIKKLKQLQLTTILCNIRFKSLDYKDTTSIFDPFVGFLILFE